MLAGRGAHAQGEFSLWLQHLRTEAMLSGISDETALEAVNHIQFLPDVIALDRSQPEFISPFLEYYQKRVNAQKLQNGQQLLAEHAQMLNQIEAQYGVSKFALIAFWGMETQYGRNQGKLDVLSSLATLAYEGRRTDFFRGQLLDAMRMIDNRHVTIDALKGSWAGAYGNMQFMPTTFMLYAVDGDSDGNIDVANSLPDAFASAANYLSQIGWRSHEPVMLEVQLPESFDWSSAQLNIRKPIQAWSKLGVRALHLDAGVPSFIQTIKPKAVRHKVTSKKVAKKSVNKLSNQPSSTVTPTVRTVNLDMLALDVKGPAAILLPQGYRGPAFMVFDNFDVIMDWNRSVNYALSVAQMAEQLQYETKRIVGGQAAEDGALSFSEMLDLQSILNMRGFIAGEPDGLPGFKTQQALREYQLANKLPADGYASRSIYQRIYAEHYQKP
ncbi:MAG: lytic murein transglycosylase [Methylotenera sp. 24-45-7]|nr:MAG: lytic murein transglycosylase [Methylotenera sp. 24-45-7]OZA08924.1 MAG: lytic murein transglycosylase [Methylotenera sp. 17-45-7]OZA54473.1 MAG: lytic murein transglycosylase [Methylophilales bacterium 39-45-7]